MSCADPRDGAEETATIPALTQWFTDELERAIRLSPHQYWWLHNRWKDTRGRKRTRKNAA